MADTHFYFASTPLHVLLFSAVALSRPKTKHVLLLIDQPNNEQNPYIAALQAWKASPFLEVHLYEGQNKKGRRKVKARQAIFAKIAQLAEQHQPNVLLTGSDKRLEFQYCASLNPSTHNIYIDEGTYTYIPPSKAKQLSHTLFDTPAKKMTYGNWYKNTPFTAGSTWVHEIWAAFPNQVHRGLHNKTIKPFPAELLEHPALQSLSSLLLAPTGFELASLYAVMVIISLPHESLLKNTAHWPAFFAALDKKSIPFAVKYHPRDPQQDSLNAQRFANCTRIPQTIFFEALLPAINESCTIIGDVSTVLLNTKWLKPKASSIAVLENNDQKNKRFIDFYHKIGVTVITPDKLRALPIDL